MTLLHFVKYLDHTSALMRELHPENAELYAWLNGSMTAALLAELYDLINIFRYEFECSNTPKGKRKPKQPKPYKRPGIEDKSERVIGRDPIPISEFDDWWNSKNQGGEN